MEIARAKDLLLAHFPGACVHGEEYVLEYALLTVTTTSLSHIVVCTALAVLRHIHKCPTDFSVTPSFLEICVGTATASVSLLYIK
jgi:hypothetical protein